MPASRKTKQSKRRMKWGRRVRFNQQRKFPETAILGDMKLVIGRSGFEAKNQFAKERYERQFSSPQPCESWTEVCRELEEKTTPESSLQRVC